MAMLPPDMVAMFGWLASTGYSADAEVLANLSTVPFQLLSEWAAAQDWDTILQSP